MQSAFIVLQSLLVVLKQIESSLKAKRFGAMWLLYEFLFGGECYIANIHVCSCNKFNTNYVMKHASSKKHGPATYKNSSYKKFLSWNMKCFSTICTPNLISTFIVNLAVNNYVLRKLYETHSIYLKEPITRFYNSQGFVSSTPICLCII